MVLGRGVFGPDQPKDPQAVSAPVPLPFAVSCTWKDTGYFQGKLLVNESNQQRTQVVSVITSEGAIRVRDQQIAKAGDPFIIYDLQAGDEFRIPNIVHLGIEGKNARLITNCLTQVRIDKGQWSFGPGIHQIRLSTGIRSRIR